MQVGADGVVRRRIPNRASCQFQPQENNGHLAQFTLLEEFLFDSRCRLARGLVEAGDGSRTLQRIVDHGREKPLRHRLKTGRIRPQPCRVGHPCVQLCLHCFGLADHSRRLVVLAPRRNSGMCVLASARVSRRGPARDNSSLAGASTRPGAFPHPSVRSSPALSRKGDSPGRSAPSI